MRRLTLACSAILAASFGLAACATTAYSNAYSEQRSAEAQRDLARYLDGRVPGKAQNCLPSFQSRDMVVIDSRTILFRDGANRVWRNELRSPCTGLGRPGTALVTKQFGTSSLCSGEIAQVLDTSANFIVGSCSLGDFVPYTGRGRR